MQAAFAVDLCGEGQRQDLVAARQATTIATRRPAQQQFVLEAPVYFSAILFGAGRRH